VESPLARFETICVLLCLAKEKEESRYYRLALDEICFWWNYPNWALPVRMREDFVSVLWIRSMLEEKKIKTLEQILWVAVIEHLSDVWIVRALYANPKEDHIHYRQLLSNGVWRVRAMTRLLEEKMLSWSDDELASAATTFLKNLKGRTRTDTFVIMSIAAMSYKHDEESFVEKIPDAEK